VHIAIVDAERLSHLLLESLMGFEDIFRRGQDSAGSDRSQCIFSPGCTKGGKEG
jgi:hypothetical protein